MKCSCAIGVILVAGLACGSAASAASPRDPELLAHDYGRDTTDSKSSALVIRTLDVDVKIAGDVARTAITATFANPTPRVLEGDFVYDLPSGAVITGYGLDVGGKLMDGVLVARRQATLVYQSKVRRRLDPGLAEITREHAFRTHIYPIIEGKDRTIRLEFVTPVSKGDVFALPFEIPDAVENVSFHVSSDAADAPALSGPGLDLKWTKDGKGWKAEATEQKIALHGALAIGPVTVPAALVEKTAAGDSFAELSGTVPTGPQTSVSRLRVYWDTSLSRRNADLAEESELLRKYVSAAKPQFVDLVTYSDGKPAIETFSSDQFATLESKLSGLRYLGATSLAAMRQVKLAPVDRCLMFTDGNITIDSYSAAPLPCPASIVSSAKDANSGFLETLAERSGGLYFDLRTQHPDAIVDELLRSPPRVTQVTDAAGHSLDFTSIAAGSPFRIIVPTVQSGDIRVRLSNGDVRSFHIDAAQTLSGDDLGALWANGHVAEMEATDRPDRDAILALARKFSIATPDIDFLVLENVFDYVMAKIEPPDSFGADFRKKYLEDVSSLSKREADQKASHLDEVIAAWNEEKIWWNTKFPEQHKNPPKLRQQTDSDRMVPPPPPPPPQATGGAMSSPMAVQTVVVTAEKREESSVENEIDVAVQPWDPDRPYIKALKGSPPGAFWTVFSREQQSFGDQPSFYLDMAEYAFRQNRKADAIELALSALDVANDDTTTLHVVADHLLHYGANDRALWLYDRETYLDPDRPQPYRSLALALVSLADNAAKTPATAHDRREEYSRALGLLNDVATRVWPDEFKGIEVVALMEANRIVPKLHALGMTNLPLDPRLTALLDVDLRIVLEWNTDKTDMDLWVDDPTGERAIYSHPKTEIGGRLSHDMTQGYGPEEFLLHHAIGGAYTIRVNVYATDMLNRNGATIIRAHLFKNYGRKDEQEKTYEIELGPQEEQNGAHIVGTVLVGAKT